MKRLSVFALGLLLLLVMATAAYHCLYPEGLYAGPLPAASGDAKDLPSHLMLKAVQTQTALGTERVTFQFQTNPAQPLYAMPQDFVFSDAQPEQAVLTFSGSAQLPTAKTFTKAFNTPNLKQLYVEERLGKIQIFLKRQKPGTVFAALDAQKHRLVLTIQNYDGRLLKNDAVVKGVSHRQILQQTARGPLFINVLEIDPKTPNLEIRPVLANGRMGAKSRVKDMVTSYRALAGINASFFKPDAGIPLGAMILGDELVAGPLYQRVTFGMDQNNQAHMERLDLKGYVGFKVSSADAPDSFQTIKIPIHNVNQPRVSAGQAVLYTDRWGSKAPEVPKNGLQVLLVNGRVAQVSFDTPLEIPRRGQVLSGSFAAEGMAQLAALRSDTAVETVFYTIPDWSGMKHAISGGPYLLKNGNVFVDLKEQKFSHGLGTYEPRSAIGIKPNGRLLLVTVDGRQKGLSVGISLTELAHLMREMGAIEAMNLDGGSSTQMVVGNQLVNSPSVPNGVGVSTSLIIRQVSQN